jgi:hypothetical protein
MSLTTMLINILATYGIAYLISQSVLLEKPREYLASKHRLIGELLYCPICLSYWIALIITGDILESFAIMGGIAIIQIYATHKECR